MAAARIGMCAHTPRRFVVHSAAVFVPPCRKHGAVFQSELQLTGAYTGAYVSDWLQIVRCNSR